MDEVGHDRKMGLPTTVFSDDRSWFGGGGEIRTTPPEYHSIVYRDSSNTGTMSGSEFSAGGAGDLSVVGAGHPQLRTGIREGGGRSRGVGGGVLEGGRLIYGGGGRRLVTE